MSERTPWWHDAPPSRPRRVSGGIQIHGTRGAVARTWWSARFIEVLESLGVGGRLARGRTYARAGQTLDLRVEPGAVVARVQGTRPQPYRVRIGLRTYGKAEWAAVEQALAEDAWYAATLLAGRMPPEIEQLFTGLGLALFPAGGHDLSMDCSCPDHAVPCKHLAAVFYILAERFDADPFEVLTLRGRDRETLLANLRTRRSDTGPAPEAPTATPLADLLDAFFTAGPAGAAADLPPPPTPPDALLDQLPAFPIDVRGHRVVDLLRPAYRALGDTEDSLVRDVDR
ncbi:SWIM zinc finger family protein [Pseudonocardia hispaniensis]|uniref:SWIM zinc finger family protein n=1 Tax=Pseudonocardia hispaniensis TaxID=904933 RepID=A0ABW1J030_9PSEU